MSMQVSYKKQILLGFCFLIIIFSTTEFSLRIYEIIFPVCNFIGNPVFEKNSFLLNSLICLDSTSIQYTEQPVRRHLPNQHFTTVNINSDGFRGDEINNESNDYRIFFLGGSTAFGMGSTSNETTISSILEKKFRDDGLDLSIINAGVGGTISFEEKYLAENFLLQYEPDLFIIYDGGNDVRYRITEPQEKINFEEKKNLKFSDLPFYRTPFVITKILGTDINDDSSSTKEIISEQTKEIIINNYIKNWSSFCESISDKNIKAIIILQPIVGTSNQKFFASDLEILLKSDSQHEINMLKDISKNLHRLENCYATIDLLSVFDNVSEPVFYDQIHVSDYGNMLIAERIHQEIKDLIYHDIKK